MVAGGAGCACAGIICVVIGVPQLVQYLAPRVLESPHLPPIATVGTAIRPRLAGSR